ncbi:Innexin inx2 [Folsomia candida]|uniref:Innexin n=1 Tax=Folsomia candida TaxID=158441 RepID=A0A226DK52_FOLCA|nr:Innexin inx2 [Folsomia candida]
MPPLTTAAILTFIPNNIWSPLKKFLTRDGIITFDLAFKISTKYTPALLTVGICLSFANQFVRNLEIDCVTNVDDGGGGGGGGNRRGGGVSVGGSVISDLNDYCWNHDTFLVVKALEPEMRGEVSYPGVSGYRKDRDAVIRQRYYKFVWMILAKMAVFSFLPYFFWKARGVTKLKPLLDVSSSPGDIDITEHDIRVKYFLETAGFNDSFAVYYFFCKIFATLTPVAEYFYLSGIIGLPYRYYGVSVFAHFFDDSAPWPNPMDVLFPKMAKCNWIQYGFGGDPEIKSAQCQLPMNNLTQWSFFVFWWWLAFTFVVNLLSLFRISLFMCGPYRKYSYRRFVSRACRDDVEKARSYVFLEKGAVLSFIKRNLEEWEFREFIRTMATTKNHFLQLNPVIATPPAPKQGSLGGDKLDKGGPEPPNEMGFIIPNSILGANFIHQTPTAPFFATPPYSDQSTAEMVTEGDEWSDSVVPSPPLPGWSIPLKDPVTLERRSSSGYLGGGKPKHKVSKKSIPLNPAMPAPRYAPNKGGNPLYTRSNKGPNYPGMGDDERYDI